MVVGFEDEFGELRRGDDYSGDLAELKVDDRAEFLRELGEGVVGHVGEEMEVTDYGERRWRRWCTCWSTTT